MEQTLLLNATYEPLKPLTQPVLYTEDDLHVRQFTGSRTSRLSRKGQGWAA
jgi:hypothetical protein